MMLLLTTGNEQVPPRAEADRPSLNTIRSVFMVRFNASIGMAFRQAQLVPRVAVAIQNWSLVALGYQWPALMWRGRLTGAVYAAALKNAGTMRRRY